jgi:hypothetical protein
VFFSLGYFYRLIGAVAGAAPDPEIDRTMLYENGVATPAKEITYRHGVDRRSLLPTAALRDAVPRNPTTPSPPKVTLPFSSIV